MTKLYHEVKDLEEKDALHLLTHVNPIDLRKEFYKLAKVATVLTSPLPLPKPGDIVKSTTFKAERTPPKIEVTRVPTKKTKKKTTKKPSADS